MQVPCPYCKSLVPTPASGQYTCPRCRAIFKVDLGDGAPPPAAPPASTPPAATGGAASTREFHVVEHAGAVRADGRGAAAEPPGGRRPPPTQGGSPESAAPARVPEGARCARHPELAAVYICARCGSFACAGCSFALPEGVHCVDCVERVRAASRSTPWEERHRLGAVPALVETVRGVLFDTAAFFRKMPREGGYGGPIAFMVILSVAQAVLTTAAMWTGGLAFGPKLFAIAGGPPRSIASHLLVQSAEQLVCGPPAAVLAAFVGGAIFHAGLAILGAARYPYEATVRVYCYASATAVGSVVLLPIALAIGGLLAFGGSSPGALLGGAGVFGLASGAVAVWGLAILVIGLREAHETTTARALLAVLLPVLLTSCCIAGFAGLAITRIR